MGKTILEEAIADAQQLKEVAIQQAKNTLVEALSSKIKTVVENQLGMSEMAALSSTPGGVAGVQGPMDELAQKLQELGLYSEVEGEPNLELPPAGPDVGGEESLELGYEA